jgi:hypothetical protein
MGERKCRSRRDQVCNCPPPPSPPPPPLFLHSTVASTIARLSAYMRECMHACMRQQRDRHSRNAKRAKIQLNAGVHSKDPIALSLATSPSPFVSACPL